MLATVVRTVSVTAAKAGAKAIIRPDGSIVAGWIGGGCARGAVLKAAREALADGEPRMVSVQPEEPARRTRRQARREPRRRALCAEHVPEQGHHGHFRRAGTAASLAGGSRREPGGDVAGGAGAAARLPCHASRRPRPIVLPSPTPTCLIDGFELAPSQRRPALCRDLDARQGRRGRVEGCRSGSMPRITPSSAAAARWPRCARN